MRLRPYLRALQVQTQVTLRYRGNVFAFLSYVLIPPLAVFFLWRAVLGGERALGGYDLSTMVTYYIVTQYFVANTAFSAWTDIGEEIRDGRLTLWLLRPASHYGLYFARNIGGWIPYWTVGLLGAAAVAGILHRYFRRVCPPGHLASEGDLAFAAVPVRRLVPHPDLPRAGGFRGTAPGAGVAPGLAPHFPRPPKAHLAPGIKALQGSRRLKWRSGRCCGSSRSG